MASGLIPEFALLVTNLYAPAGTRIPMQQSAPPLGWTSDVSAAFTDCSMRINSGSGGGTGGSTLWSAWNFGGTFNVNGFTISTAQMPSHSHTIPDPGHSHSSPGHTHTGGGGFGFWTSAPGQSLNFLGGANAIQNSATTDATAITINTAFTGQNATNANGSGATITPNYTTPQVKFADHIIAVKS